MKIKLGKRPAKIDKRTLPFTCCLKPFPEIPHVFDLEINKNIPTPMYANDIYGSCVIAGRAHQTLRFELFEQGKILHITDEEVLNQYWKEGKRFCFDKKPDRGLVMLDSLKRWRNEGWVAAGREYNIYAFAKINHFDRFETKAAMYLLNGINVGLMLPNSARNQDIWRVEHGEDAKLGSWGGHCVFITPIWDGKYLNCITWGDEKMMTWEFFITYCDEAFAIVDDKDHFLPNSPIDVELLNSYLESLG